MSEFISVRGAREHNLKNVDVEIPREKLVVITGLSGSGKYNQLKQVRKKERRSKITKLYFFKYESHSVQNKNFEIQEAW